MANSFLLPQIHVDSGQRLYSANSDASSQHRPDFVVQPIRVNGIPPCSPCGALKANITEEANTWVHLAPPLVLL